MKLLPILFALAILAPHPRSLAADAPPDYAPPAISARVNLRYSWRLTPKATRSLGKDRMATTDRYDLPASKPILKGKAAEQVIQGTTENVPLQFYIRLTRTGDTDQGLLEVNIVDPATRKSLAGFPRKIAPALEKLGTDATEIDFTLTKDLKATVAAKLSAFLKKEEAASAGDVVLDTPNLEIRKAAEGETAEAPEEAVEPAATPAPDAKPADPPASPSRVSVEDISPDHRFGLRYTYDAPEGEGTGHPIDVELVALPSGKLVRDLFDDDANRGSTASWSPDSRRLAYAPSSRRITTVMVFERRGEDTFVEVKLPDLDKFSPRSKPGEAAGHFNECTDEVRRWLGPDAFVMHRTTSFMVESPKRGDSVELSGDYEFTIRFDAASRATLGKVLKRQESRGPL